MTDDDGAQTRLATYGTLAPGKPNAYQLADLRGDWSNGTVRGRLLNEGWGAAMGFPALVLDDRAGKVAVQVFTSHDLPLHWPRLDAFEGEGYRRAPVQVETENGTVTASIYVLADR